MGHPSEHRREPDAGQPSVHGRILVPREHGAYVELVFPLVTALALGGFKLAQLLLAVAAIAVFFAHEPLLVLAGERGRRALGRFKKQAAGLAAVLLFAALTTGAIGLWAAPPGARVAALLPLTFSVLLLPLIFSRREKTLTGEMLVALTLSSASIPVAMAGGVAQAAAVTAGSVWSAIFFLETVTVRAVRASLQERIHTQGSFRPVFVAGSGAILVAGLAIVTETLPYLAASAIVPAAVIALAAGWIRLHPRRLRALGWSFAASNVLALVLLLAALD
jgi:hypothetical protein